MTTITEILAEAFNRIKTEHGVTLSRVEFEHYSGNLSGVEFTSSGIVRMAYPATGPMPPQIPAHPVPAPNTPPEGSTHYGSLDGGDPRYYRYTNRELFGWAGWIGWCRVVSLSDATDAALVEQLTPINHPTSQSSSDSGS